MKRKISASAPNGKINAPRILFGACDRHNLGDLLFPHIAAPLLAQREVVVAGLAARELTPFGGHRVRAIGEVLREMPGAPVIHVDGKPQRFDWARRPGTTISMCIGVRRPCFAAWTPLLHRFSSLGTSGISAH